MDQYQSHNNSVIPQNQENEPIEVLLGMMVNMPEQKIKQDNEIHIGKNIRSIRKAQGIGQTDLVRRLHLLNINMTRETLVKIEREIQHIQASQLRGIRDALQITYDELLK